MSYCMAGIGADGIVMLADTRTNSGVDNISIFKKLRYFNPSDCDLDFAIAMVGNLATSQELESRLEEVYNRNHADSDQALQSPFNLATFCGREIKRIIEQIRGDDPENKTRFSSSAILSTRFRGSTNIYLIYPEGNFIRGSDDTPFFQIGETKFGRPLLVRHFDKMMPQLDMLQLFRDSLDISISSNLSVGYPADYIIMENSGEPVKHGRFMDREHVDVFAKYVELRFPDPSTRHLQSYRETLVSLTSKVRVSLTEFRENVHTSNSLDDDEKAILFKSADSIDSVISTLESQDYLINSDGPLKEAWITRYAASLRNQIELLASPSLIAEKTIPISLLISLGGLGFAVAGGVGIIMGALAARTLSAKNEMSKEIESFISKRLE